MDAGFWIAAVRFYITCVYILFFLSFSSLSQSFAGAADPRVPRQLDASFLPRTYRCSGQPTIIMTYRLPNQRDILQGTFAEVLLRRIQSLVGTNVRLIDRHERSVSGLRCFIKALTCVFSGKSPNVAFDFQGRAYMRRLEAPLP